VPVFTGYIEVVPQRGQQRLIRGKGENTDSTHCPGSDVPRAACCCEECLSFALVLAEDGNRSCFGMSVYSQLRRASMMRRWERNITRSQKAQSLGIVRFFDDYLIRRLYSRI
jgi:hypothetical protein